MISSQSLPSYQLLVAHVNTAAHRSVSGFTPLVRDGNLRKNSRNDPDLDSVVNVFERTNSEQLVADLLAFNTYRPRRQVLDNRVRSSNSRCYYCRRSFQQTHHGIFYPNPDSEQKQTMFPDHHYNTVLQRFKGATIKQIVCIKFESFDIHEAGTLRIGV